MFQSSKQPPYFSYELILHHSPVPSWGQTTRSLVLFSVWACREAEPCLLWGSLHELTHKHEDESQMARLLLESQQIWASLGCFPPQILHCLPQCTACCASALKGNTEKGLCLGKRKNHSPQTQSMGREDLSSSVVVEFPVRPWVPLSSHWETDSLSLQEAGTINYQSGHMGWTWLWLWVRGHVEILSSSVIPEQEITPATP